MADFTRQYGPFLREYGVATASGAINSHIAVGIPTSTDANLYTGALAGGDVKVSKDGGAEANISSLPTQVGATGIWIFSLTGTELSCYALTIHLKKAGSTAEIVITVETTLALGRVLVDASQIGGNVNAVQLQGLGTGTGLISTGGATGPGMALRGGGTSGDGLSCIANNGNSNGATFGGLGTGAGIFSQGGANGGGLQLVGQGTGVAFSVSGATTALYHNLFSQRLDAQPAGAFSATESIGSGFGRLIRRFYNKVTQTVTVQTIYADDSVTVVTTMAVSDDGTTQSKGKSA